MHTHYNYIPSSKRSNIFFLFGMQVAFCTVVNKYVTYRCTQLTPNTVWNDMQYLLITFNYENENENIVHYNQQATTIFLYKRLSWITVSVCQENISIYNWMVKYWNHIQYIYLLSNISYHLLATTSYFTAQLHSHMMVC